MGRQLPARKPRPRKGRAAPSPTRTRPTRRPRPAREDAPREAPVVDRTERGRALSGRGLALAGAVVVVIAMFVPTANAWVQQQQQVRALEKQIDQDRGDVNGLEAEQKRWKDPAYLEQQAREKQFYVRPGEKAHVVIDPSAEKQSGPETVAEGEVALPKNDRPWYDELVDSLRRVGTEPLDSPGD